ncbi:hypothetical protein HDU82_000343 [Entophlyctis luteolus]|nr:hypothetical protein HDU82_000343 [Entophlyctis luteolus]
MGARILTAPMIMPPQEDMSHRYGYTFAKLHLWALEKLYSVIAYVDLDLIFLREEGLDAAFAIFDEWKNNQNVSNTLFGACEDWQLTGSVNSGLMLIQPNSRVYSELIKSVPQTSGFGDQRTINAYFMGLNASDRAKTILLPRKFNTQWVMQRTDSELAEAVAFHHKFLTDTVPAGVGKKLFAMYSARVLKVREFQMRRSQLAAMAGNNDTSVAVVPIVEEEYTKAKELMRLKTRFDRLAVLSWNTWDERELEARDRFARTYSQAMHFSFHDRAPDGRNLSQVISQLSPFVEWVWILSSHASFSNQTSSRPVHFQLEKWLDNPDKAVLNFEGPCSNQSMLLHTAEKELLFDLGLFGYSHTNTSHVKANQRDSVQTDLVQC